jgi:hypothetical protein
MPRVKTKDRDGVYQRKDRRGWWISFIDVKGRRRRRKVDGAHKLQQARAALAAELQRVEKTRIYGIPPPRKETFSDVAARYLVHQRARLTPAAYERTRRVSVSVRESPREGPLFIQIERKINQR